MAALNGNACRGEYHLLLNSMLILCVLIIASETGVTQAAFACVCQEEPRPAVQSKQTCAGKVIDPDGNPVGDAMIAISLYRFSTIDSALTPDSRIDLGPVPTDSKGEFVLEFPDLGLKPSEKIYLEGHIVADGFPHCRLERVLAQGEVASYLTDIKLEHGRRVTGRLLPDSAARGEQDGLVNPRIQLMGVMYDGGPRRIMRMWTSANIACDAEGYFEAWVADNGLFRLLASADGSAKVEVDFGESDNELGNIEIPRGTTVFGRLSDEQDRPLAGIVVAIKQNLELDEAPPVGFPGAGNVLPFPRGLYAAALTDSAGRFRLPPIYGNCHLAVLETIRDKDGHWLVSEAELPVIAPEVVELPRAGDDYEWNLQQGPTIIVSGTVYWEDGSTVADVVCAAHVMTGATGVSIHRTTTDMSGQYDLLVPQDADQVVISVLGARDDSGEWLSAFPDNELDALQKTGQTLGLEMTGEDIDGADWVLREREFGMYPER
ncbi:MAG: hypothetical protein ACR2NP_21475 [Pirellulaceae bacterium]